MISSTSVQRRSHPQPSRNAKIDAFQRAIPKGRGAVQERLRENAWNLPGNMENSDGNIWK